MRWFVRGDIDGFFGLALDNLVQLLLIDALCRFVLGFPAELVYGRVLPGAAVSLLVGNLFYAWQAQAARRARPAAPTSAPCPTASTRSRSSPTSSWSCCRPRPRRGDRRSRSGARRVAGRACWPPSARGSSSSAAPSSPSGSASATPRAALLSTLAGIALGFISLGFLFRTFAQARSSGSTTLGVVMLTYFGRVRFKGGMPGGLVAVALGTLLAWATGHRAGRRAAASGGRRFTCPSRSSATSWRALTGGICVPYLSVIIPMGLFNVVGSLQNIESAEAAGDRYRHAAIARRQRPRHASPRRCSARVSRPPSTSAIRAGRRWARAPATRSSTACSSRSICLTGTLAWIAWAVPIDAGMAIVLWIGIVITAQAFQATPRAHAPAVVVGLLPGVAAWGALMAKNGLRAAGHGHATAGRSPTRWSASS